MGFNAVGTNESNIGAHGAEVLSGACTNSSPGHLAQLTTDQLKGDTLSFRELHRNMQCVGDNDAVVTGLEAEVLGANVVGKNFDGGTCIQDDRASLGVTQHLVCLSGNAALLGGVHALSGGNGGLQGSGLLNSDSATVDAAELTCFFQCGEVAAHGLHGHIVTTRKVSAVDTTCGGNKLCNFGTAFFCEHKSVFLWASGEEICVFSSAFCVAREP